VVLMKNHWMRSTGKFLAGILVGGVLFSGSALAYNNYSSDNTPDGGYLLCANTKTKAVTFPNKLNCPTGFIALDLGAVEGVEGAQGPQGDPGKDATQAAGYLVTLKAQDVIASVASKSEKTLISKSGFKPGYYNLMSEISMVFQTTYMQVVLCSVKTTGNSFSYSGFPSHELANTWTGHMSQLMGVVYVASSSDSIAISCSFSGNTKVNYGTMGLTPIAPPVVSVSD
jgi:hypothetical protein